MHDALNGDRQEQSYNDSEMETEGVLFWTMLLYSSLKNDNTSSEPKKKLEISVFSKHINHY
jgi:hypothetical protein